MAEKRTKEDNRSRGGLNEGNPNIDRTPIQPRTDTDLVGGLNQQNFDDKNQGSATQNTERGKEDNTRQ